MQFAGGVAFERQHGVVAQHAAAIVGDTDQAAAAGFDFHPDRCRARVKRVFKQLLDDGSGAFHYLARGDLIGDVVGENADSAQDPILAFPHGAGALHPDFVASGAPPFPVAVIDVALLFLHLHFAFGTSHLPYAIFPES